MIFNLIATFNKGKKISLLFFLVMWVSISHFLSAQSVTRTVGSGGDYGSLLSAFTAINTGLITGEITLQIISSITAETASAVLNASGSGSANYTSITIFPTVPNCVISGNVIAPLIDFNGAKNVVIDGRVNRTGTTVSLTIDNTSTAATAGNSTIRFANGASNNTIQFCQIRGATTSSSSGIIFFSTSTGATGNHTNTIANNNLTSSTDALRPTNVIYSAGTSALLNNNSLIISGNRFFNFLNGSIASFGINLQSFTASATITGNSFYETTTFAPTANVNYTIININHNTSGGHTINDNFIGGNAPNSAGTWVKSSAAANSITGIFAACSATTNNIHGNMISGWSWANLNTTTNMHFTGIRLELGTFNVGQSNRGNVIGNPTGNGSITLSSSASAFNFYGIFSNDAVINLGFNTVGSITATNTDTSNGAMHLTGLHTVSGSGTIHNNIVGSTVTANSINANAQCNSNNQIVIGIDITGGSFVISKNNIANVRNGTTNSTTATWNTGRINGISSTPGLEVFDNTIFNLTIANANTNTNENASITGILVRPSSSSKKIWRNTIYNLSNTHASFAGNVTGIYVSSVSGAAGDINSNFIYGLNVPGASSTFARVYGINLVQGINTCHNNIINLGGETRTEIFGISESGTSGNNNNIYFNTVYLSGTAPSGATNRSYALYSNVNTNTRNFRNNILFNARSTTGGTNLHFAIFYNYGANTNLTSNFNNYLATGTGGVIGFYAAATHTLATLRSTIGQDGNSLSVNPSFPNAGGNNATDYKPASVIIGGISIPGINHDFLGASRLASPLMGAFELTSHVVEVWKNNVLQSAYINLKSAFDALNSSFHNGVLQIRIKGSTWETETAVLNAGSIAFMYDQIEIYPTIDGVQIRGDIAGPLIDFNGASNITIDGRPNKSTLTGTLQIMNESTSGGVNTSTIRFVNDANRIIVQHTTIAGSHNNMASGVVLIGTTSGINGNDNITFDNCHFTTANANARPRNMVYSAGSTGKINDNLTISNCQIYDFFNTLTQASGGIWAYGFNIGIHTSGTTILNNSFFERNPLSCTGVNGAYVVIDVREGSNVNIQGNFIGGTAALCQGGNLTKTGENKDFYGILISGTPTGNNNFIRDNTITRISWTNTGNADFVGISGGAADAGLVTISNNTIGASTGTNAIVFNAGATGATFYGIYSFGPMRVDGNRIGGITASNVSTGATHIYPIHKHTGNSNYYNNIIGSLTTPNSIHSTSQSTAAAQNVIGINIANSASTLIIDNNTIANLTNATNNTTVGTTGLINGIAMAVNPTTTITNNRIYNLNIANANSSNTHLASAAGIAIGSTFARRTITNNTIYNIHNNYNAFEGFVHGIYMTGNSTLTSTVQGNFIYNLRINGSAAASSTVIGISALNGNTIYSNNIISIGNNCTSRVIGFYDFGTVNNPCLLYNNTIYIHGTVSGSSARSMALFSAASANIRNYRNNILFNARGSDATGQHYAAFYNYAVTTNLTVNHNNYRANGLGGVLVGFAGGNLTDLAAVRTAMGQDQNSLEDNPELTNPGGTLANDYKSAFNRLIGASGTGITLDYEGTTRANPPTIGAFEGNLLLFVEVWVSKVFQKSYLTLKDAFDKINEGVHQGTIEIIINSSTTEPATATLFQSGYLGLSNFNSVHIFPKSSGLSVSGSLAQLIDLNGAQNVTIDGRVNATGTTKDLTIVNTMTASTPSTIRLINDASNNNIKYCMLRGGGTTSQGIVFVATTTATTGNNNNTIENNTFTGISAATRPSVALSSAGTVGKENKNLVVRYNHFVDLMNAATSSTSISFSLATTASIITNNSIFETTQLAPSAATNIIGINVSSGTNVIRENFIGGSAPACAGTALTKTDSNNNSFSGILVSGATGAFTEIDGNLITNFTWLNSANNIFTGISVMGGDAKIGANAGNIIGSINSANAIVFSGASNDANFYGISITSTGVVECTGNFVGGIRTTNVSTNATHIQGIRITGATGQKTITNNIVGSTTIAASIIAASNSTTGAQLVYGIFNSSSAVIRIENNIVANLTNATNSSTATVYGLISGIYSNTGSNTVNNNLVYNLTIASNNTLSTVAASASGIAISSTSVSVARGNTIYNITNTNENFAGHITGLFFSGSTSPNEVTGNFIYNINVSEVSSTTTAASIYGIRASAGVTTYSNNIVHVGGNSNATIYGFHDLGAANQHCTVLHNTIFISGTSAAGSLNKSYALFSQAANNTKNYRNNILFNSRSTTGGSNLHYAISITGTTNLTSDFNDLLVTGAGGTIGFFTTNRQTLADWRTGTSRDMNSRSDDPLFANQGGNVPADYVPRFDRLFGTPTAGISTDFNGRARGTIPTMGAWEGNLAWRNVSVFAGGVYEADYFTLKAAFDQINLGTHRGILQIRINGSTDELAAAVLNASGSGSSNYSSITIFPTTTGLSVSGNLTVPLIDLNGADFVTIDGRVNATGSIRDLTISNLQTSTTTSTIRLYNDASNNTIRFCTLRGTSITAGTQGIVSITTGTSTGNINNTIDNNNFTGLSDTQRHILGVYSNGTSATVSNRNITISNNHFYNLFHMGANSWNINLANNTTACSVTGNSFFESNVLIPTANTTYSAIHISNTAGSNFTVSGNHIGGNAPQASGTLQLNSTFSNLFYGIYLNPGTSVTSNVQGNTITNMNWTCTGTTITYWVGIMVERGNANVGTITGNTIGSTSGNNAIQVSFEANNSEIYAYSLLAWGTGTMNFENNSAGSITINSSNPNNAVNFYGVISGNGTINIINNLIGSISTENSIRTNATSVSTAQLMYGMQNNSTGSVLIRNNTIANLTNGTTSGNTGRAGLVNGILSTAGTNTITSNTIYNLSIANANVSATHTASVGGIVLSGVAASTTNNVSRNTIYNLSNHFVNFFGHVRGIYFSGNASTANVCSQNLVHSLTNPNSQATRVSGIWAQAGQTTYSNNIVRLGDNTGNPFYGIYDLGASGQTCNLYHNTVYIDGEPTSSVGLTAALWSNAAANVRNYRNNIFHNARSNNGATSKHYAAFYNYTTTGSLTNNFNNYMATGTGGVLAFFNTVDLGDLSALQSAMGQDANSLQTNPVIALPSGTLAENFRASKRLRGISIPEITTDFGNQPRPTPPQMGAWELLLNMWKGATSNDWNTPANWTLNLVPEPGEDIEFDPAPQNHAVLDRNRSIGSLINAQSTYRTVTNGYQLTIHGDLVFNNGAQIDASAIGSTLEFAGTSLQSIPSGSLHNNQVFNLTVNNANHVMLHGTMNLLNVLATTNGRLNATSQSPTLTYGGAVAQTIENNQFTNNQVFNLTIDNPAGVTLNTEMEIANNMLINNARLFSIAPNRRLRVNGTLTNNAGTAGLVIASTATGTGSLIHNTNNVPATVQRFVHGAASNWHFLSSPVTGQEISGEWKPAGTYSDGTGYDLFVWDEPNSCWVYNLNNTVSPTWPSVHPQTQFIPGRGYLYAFQTETPTKQFLGNLNNGTVTLNVSSSSINEYQGFNFIGNPYPSSIDWKSNTGFSRNILFENGGGYDIWIWNPEFGNYGVFNSADPEDNGTNGITRYIAPMQAFFVRAANAGQISMNNNSRDHTGASAWKVKNETKYQSTILVNVKAASNLKSDEVKLILGNSKPAAGAIKLFSHEPSSPSLYIQNKKQKLSIFTPGEVAVIDIAFKAGIDGAYQLSLKNSGCSGQGIILEDKLLNTSRRMLTNDVYPFVATRNDSENRFRIRLSEDPVSPGIQAKVYTSKQKLIADLTELSDTYSLLITDVSGRIIFKEYVDGGKKHEYPLIAKGIYLLQLVDSQQNEKANFKVVH